LQINGVRVAFLGFVDMPLEGMMPLADLPGPALADTARLLPAVRAARAKADRVVVLLHWGREYSPIPTEQQRQLAGAIVEAGANLVVGSHPHVLQTVERVGKGIVFYSVGNFVFDQSGEERSSSVLVNARFGPAGDCIGITPIRIDRCQPRLASGVEADRVIEMLQSRSPEVHLAKSSAGEWVVE
jgi:poly-gamma-glutamate synthesis protein (capsule biosynthesis protein)